MPCYKVDCRQLSNQVSFSFLPISALRLGGCLAARGESTIGRAHRYCGQDQGARRKRCGDIVDDEQRRDCPQYLCAQRVPAAQGHLLRWRSSTISPYRLRRAALHLPLRRSERDLLYFHHGLLGTAFWEAVDLSGRITRLS